MNVAKTAPEAQSDPLHIDIALITYNGASCMLSSHWANKGSQLLNFATSSSEK